jgi:hypothetical protein
MEDTKTDYERKYQAQVDEWKATVDKWSAQARKADADARIQLSAHLDKIRAKQKLAEARLHELRSAGNEAWRDLKSGLEDAARDLSHAVENARRNFS